MRKLFKTVLIFSILFSSDAFANQHFYRIYNFSWPEASSCQSEANRISSLIAASENVVVTGSICERSDSTERTTVTIAYQSAEPLLQVSTYTFESTYQTKGIYPSKESCEANLEAEAEVFRSNSGLAPLFKFCGHEKLYHKLPWYPHIEAIGTPDLFPSRSSWRSDYQHGDDESGFKQKVTERMQSAGAILTHLTWRSTGAGGEYTAFYYAPKQQMRLQMSPHIIATIPGIDNCLKQVASTEEQLARNPQLYSFSTYCSSGYSNPTRFELVTLLKGMDFFQSIESIEVFSDFVSCSESVADIANGWRAVYGDRLLVAVCGYPKFSSTPGKFKVLGLKSYQ